MSTYGVFGREAVQLKTHWSELMAAQWLIPRRTAASIIDAYISASMMRTIAGHGTKRLRKNTN